MGGATEELLVILRASTAQFEEKFASAEAQVQGFATKSTGGLQKFAALGGASLAVAGLAAVAIGVVSVKAADDFEKSHARLETAVKRAGLSFEDERGKIDDSNRAMERLGITNDESENSLARLITATKDVGKAQHDQAVAADLAAARGISLQAATDILVKVESGRYTALGRLGIATKDQIAGFKDSADAIDYLSDKYKGSAAAAADTFGGKIKVLEATVTDLAVSIGLVLIPVIEDIVSGLSDTFHWFQDNETAAYALGGVIAAVLVPAMVTFIALKVAAAASAIAASFGAIADFTVGAAAGFHAVAVAEEEAAIAAGEFSAASGAAGFGVLAGGALATLGPLALVVGSLQLITGGALTDFSNEVDNVAAKSKNWAEQTVAASQKATGSLEGARHIYEGLGAEADRLRSRGDLLLHATSGGSDEWHRYGRTLLDVQNKSRDLGDKADTLTGRQKALKDAIDKVAAKAREEARSHVDASGKVTGHVQTVKELEAALKAAAAAQDLENNATIASFSSELQASTSLKTLTDDVNDHKDSLTIQGDALSAAGAKAKAWGDELEAQSGVPLTAKQKSDLFKQALLELQGQFPGLAGQLQGYIDRLNSIPANKDTAVTTTYRTYVETPQGVISGGGGRGHWGGGPIGGMPGAQVPFLGHGGEYVLDADTVSAIKSGKQSRSSGRGTSASEAGGGVVHNHYYALDVSTFTAREAADVVFAGLQKHVQKNGPGALRQLVKV